MRDTLALAGPLVFAAIASIFAAFVFFLSAVGSGATESMPIAGPHAALCVALGLLVPVVSFGALDACYSADDWFFLLGIMAAKKGTSSEPVHAVGNISSDHHRHPGPVSSRHRRRGSMRSAFITIVSVARPQYVGSSCVTNCSESGK